MDDETLKRMSQFLASEHATLQNARNALVVEGNGRTSAFLSTISAAFVALALVFQIARFGQVFLLVSLVLIPILCFIGLSTYVRLVHIDFADVAYTAAINRIRAFYLASAPEIRPYLSFPAFDDPPSVQRSRVIYTSFVWTVLSYPSGLILVIDSLLLGIFGSLLLTALFRLPVLALAVFGLLLFLLAGFVQYRLATRWLAAVTADFQPRFPAPAPAQTKPPAPASSTRQ